MSRPDEAAAQLLCEHRWVRSTTDHDEPHCPVCDLSYGEYVEVTVRAALSRVDAL